MRPAVGDDDRRYRKRAWVRPDGVEGGGAEDVVEVVLFGRDEHGLVGLAHPTVVRLLLAVERDHPEVEVVLKSILRGRLEETERPVARVDDAYTAKRCEARAVHWDARRSGSDRSFVTPPGRAIVS